MNFEFNLEGSLFDTIFQFEKSAKKEPKPEIDLAEKSETTKRKMRRIKK